MPDEDLLRKIDSKLAALLALSLDQYLRETGVARPKPRSIDRLLTDAGLTTAEVSALLGKTARAVNLALSRERAAKTRRSSQTKPEGKV